MLFTTFQYLVFFSLFTIAYFVIWRRLRWVLLLGASYYFYACWKLEYVALLAAATLVTYAAGLGIVRAKSGAGRKAALVVGTRVIC